LVHVEAQSGGIVLCGGRSTRMGRSKALLPFGPELMLQRVVRILREVVSPVVVVASREQELPDLPAEVEIAWDEHDALGPLAGLAAGLKALRGRVEAVYASSCDVPLLEPAFIRTMLAELQDADLAIPRDEQFYHPLAAVYRVSLEEPIRALISTGRLRFSLLVELSRTQIVDVQDLRRVDPELRSLRNINTPEDYAEALGLMKFQE
jgi:molybdopterin-guanine dinucleotide biosynthesis protein A